jgi:MraZ protein
MILFRGTQTGNVDEKGRLKLPAKVRQRLENQYGNRDVFITSLDGKVVKLFPLREWEAAEARLSEKSTESKEMDGEVKDKILFQANKYGSEESLDNQGRVLVPAVLRETAGMSGEVKILWSSNHMLVLSGSQFDKVSEQKELTDEESKHVANLGV